MASTGFVKSSNLGSSSINLGVNLKSLSPKLINPCFALSKSESDTYKVVTYSTPSFETASTRIVGLM